MPRLLLVSNRLPVTLRVEADELNVVPSAGGLATALRGLHEHHGKAWIGWPGDVAALSVEQRNDLDKRLEPSAPPLYT